MATETRSPRYVATLAVVAAALLGVGLALKPERQRKDVVAAPSQTEMRRLQRMSLRQSVDGISELFSLVVGDLEPYVVRVTDDGGTTGLVWSPDFVISSSRGWSASRAAILATGSGDPFPAARVVAGPHLPLSGFQATMPQGLRPAPRNLAAPDPGEWLIAVWRQGRELSFAPGHSLGARSADCAEHRVRELVASVAFSPAMAGGAVFDLDGRMSAVVLDCGDRFAAVAVPSVDALLREGRSARSRILDRYGMLLELMTPAERRHLEPEDGALVREVWAGYPAARFGLQPGDVITELDGAAITFHDLEERLLGPRVSEAFLMGVRRGPQSLELSLSASTADSAPTGSDAGIVWREPERGYPVRAVVPGSRASAAGIRAGDRVVRLDHAEPRNLAQVRRVLSGRESRPVFVELERGPRRVGVLVEPELAPPGDSG